MELLVAKGIHKRFGGLQALTALDISVVENTIHSVIGPNGAGKTTFFNCLTGLYQPEMGTVIFDGKPLVGPLADAVGRSLAAASQFACATDELPADEEGDEHV